MYKTFVTGIPVTGGGIIMLLYGNITIKTIAVILIFVTVREGFRLAKGKAELRKEKD